MTEVHFCNLCDQSVPQDQLDDGEAVRHGGRTLCASCRATLTMAATGERPRSSASLLVPLVVGLLGWGAAAYVWLEVQDLRGDSERASSSESVVLSNGLRSLEDRLAVRMARLDDRANEQELGLNALRQDQARAAEAVQAQLLALERSVERIPDLVDAVEREESRIREVEAARTLATQDISDLRSALEIVRNSLTGLEQRVSSVPAQAAPTGFPREVEDLLAQLRDPDPLQRSIALEKLGRHSDARLVGFVEPMLKDNYEMNRFYAATHLGAWKSQESVPALVEALLDEYSLVRKAANEALVSITGQDQNFDPKAPENERKKAYERWKQWSAQKGSAPTAG